MQPIPLMLDVLLLADPWSASGSMQPTVSSYIHETGRLSRMSQEEALVELFGVIARPMVPEERVMRTCEQLACLFRAIKKRLVTELWAECQPVVHPDYHGYFAWTTTLPNDPIRLRALAFPAQRPRTIEAQRESYDARFLYFMTYRVLQLLLDNDRWYRECLCSEEIPTVPLGIHALYPDRVHMQCVEQLQRFGVLSDRRRNIPVSIDAPLNPEDECRYTSMEQVDQVDETLEMIRVPIEAYQLACDTEDTVSVLTRIKSLFRLWCKWTREQTRVDLPYVPDAIGARLVLLDESRYDAAVAFISEHLEAHAGGTVLRRRPRLEDDSDRFPNIFAAPEFRAETFRTEFGGLRTEVQLMTLRQFVNIVHSRGEELATRYRLRQLWPILPVLRPRELWDFEWFNRRVFDKCDRWLSENRDSSFARTA